jgi:hypothetical protein
MERGSRSGQNARREADNCAARADADITGTRGGSANDGRTGIGDGRACQYREDVRGPQAGGLCIAEDAGASIVRPRAAKAAIERQKVRWREAVEQIALMVTASNSSS